MAPLGAVRESVGDVAWQQHIGELMETARLIVVSVARTQHCVPESEDIARRGLLHRTGRRPDDMSYREAIRRATAILEHDDLPAGIGGSHPPPRVLAPLHWGQELTVWPRAGPLDRGGGSVRKQG